MNRKQWAKEFFAVVDSRQPEKIAAYMTDDVRLQMANMEPSVGVDFLKAAFQGAADRFKSISHKIQGVWAGQWESGDVVSVEAIVRYELPSGKVVELPCTSTLRFKGEKIADYRIFIEPSPAFVD
jgi:ketosteroid isomerase-like protein